MRSGAVSQPPEIMVAAVNGKTQAVGLTGFEEAHEKSIHKAWEAVDGALPGENLPSYPWTADGGHLPHKSARGGALFRREPVSMH